MGGEAKVRRVRLIDSLGLARIGNDARDAQRCTKAGAAGSEEAWGTQAEVTRLAHATREKRRK
jgi:hypothetical protein